MNKYIYRILNPRNDNDIKNYFELVSKLNDFCNSKKIIDDSLINWDRFHMGAIEYIDKNINKDSLPSLEDNAHEFVFVCEYNNKFIGYSKVCSYHIVNGICPDDDIGILHEIYVLDEYRDGIIAYTLLQMAIYKLIEKGKNKAICNVQDTNKNKYLHFAMANNNIIDTNEVCLDNGNKTIDYTLLIDLLVLKNMSFFELGKKAVKLKKLNSNNF